MFSQTVEYALRAVVHLAFNATESQTTEQIARATKVPQAYLSKVLQSLVAAGVVKSQRGIGGGMSLVKKPRELTILEVVNAVDPIQRIKTCPLRVGLARRAVVSAAPPGGQGAGAGRGRLPRDDAARGDRRTERECAAV